MHLERAEFVFPYKYNVEHDVLMDVAILNNLAFKPADPCRKICVFLSLFRHDYFTLSEITPLKSIKTLKFQRFERFKKC